MLDLVEKLKQKQRTTSFRFADVQASQAAQGSLKEEIEHMVSRFKEMFTDISEPTIRYIVSSNDNKEAAALDTLLAMQAVDAGTGHVAPSSSSQSTDPKPPRVFSLMGASMGESSSDSVGQSISPCLKGHFIVLLSCSLERGRGFL